MVGQSELQSAYRDVRLACQCAWQSDAVDVAIGRLAELALRFLSEEADLVALRSSVAGKSYVSFSCINIKPISDLPAGIEAAR